MAVSREVFAEWTREALQDLGGSGTIKDVCKQVWQNHGAEIQDDEDAFFTWQYEIRWGGQILRDSGVLKSKDDSPRGTWELNEAAAVRGS